MGFIKKLFKKQITRKFFWSSMLIIVLFFLKIVDIILTLIALNLKGIYKFKEVNPFAYFLVDNPIIWITITCITMFTFILINLLLWFLDRKTERKVDVITFVFDIVIVIMIVISLLVVVNNVLAFYSVLK